MLVVVVVRGGGDVGGGVGGGGDVGGDVGGDGVGLTILRSFN